MAATERVTLSRGKVHKGIAVGIGTDELGREVAVAVTRQDWLTMQLAGLQGGVAVCEVEDWRIVQRRGVVA